MALLTPDPGLLFWMLISFGIVFGILARFGFPVITRMVDKRRDYIQKSLEVADEAHRKLKTVNEESERILGDAHRRQAEILKTAISEGEQIVQNAKVRAAQEAEKQLAATRARTEAMKAKALADVNSTVAMLSCEIAEKVLRHELADREQEETLILQMLGEAEDVRRKRSHNNQQ
jgi:F-type H+-transporting ATPase subunit b